MYEKTKILVRKNVGVKKSKIGVTKKQKKFLRKKMEKFWCNKKQKKFLRKKMEKFWCKKISRARIITKIYDYTVILLLISVFFLDLVRSQLLAGRYTLDPMIIYLI